MLHVPPSEVLTAKERMSGDQAVWNVAVENSCFTGSVVGTGCCLPTYLASRVRAMIPAAKGAEAEVPV